MLRVKKLRAATGSGALRGPASKNECNAGVTRRRRVAVVGGGWSGLAAAVALVERGHGVTVFEAAPEPGGRARGLTLDGLALDNGQHLLLGAYEATCAAMRTVGVEPEQAFERRPLSLDLRGAGERMRLQMPRAGGPLALSFALATMRGPSLGARMTALRHAPCLRRLPPDEQSAADWLHACGQPPALVRGLWAPLCLAALNAPPARASARLLGRVLGEAFAHPRAGDLLLPRRDLGDLFPRPARAWLEARGQRYHAGTRIRRLAGAGDGWCLNDEAARFDDVVLAADPAASARLLPDDAGGRALGQRLRGLRALPIATVYLRYPRAMRLPHPMMGRLDGPGQWIFDRRLTGQPGVLGVVISGSGPHTAWSRDELATAVCDQLAGAWPDWPRPAVIGVVREKRATFDPRPGSEGQRVDVRGPQAGLWFAGDHVRTGLPATLEGAVRAGHTCAEAIDQEPT